MSHKFQKLKSNHNHILLYRCLFTIIVILLYMLGRHIPLYGVDVASYQAIESLDAQTYFLQTLSGDFNNYSIYILGLWPYMLATMIAIIYQAIKSIDKTNPASPKQINWVTIILTLVVGAIQGYQRIGTLYFKETAYPYITQAIAFVEMIAGMLVVMYLCDRNTKYGIGGRMSVFLVNMISGVFSMASGSSFKDLIIPLAWAILGILLMIVLETTEKRLPVQRVSIHNIYADKNYIPIKLNPAGIMPVMFASAAFMLPQLIFKVLLKHFPNNAKLQSISDQMVMTAPLGIVTYLIIMCILVISFAFMILSPGNLADGLLKTGDSILDIYAGKQTKKYLRACVLRFSIYSSILLCLYFSVPLILQYKGIIGSNVSMLPSSIMMSTGLWISLYREAKVYYDIDHYNSII